MAPAPQAPLLVLYDGGCGFCAAAARFLQARDRRGALRLVPLEAAEAAPWRAHASEVPGSGALDTLVVVDRGAGGAPAVHVRAAAVARALRALPPPWSLAGAALARAPRRAADAAYRAVARRRGRACRAR